MQVRRHVAEWIAKAVPDGLDLTPIQRVRLARRRTLPRAGSIFCIAGDWRVEVITEGAAPAAAAAARSHGATPLCDLHGDPRYLLAAVRLSERQLSLAGMVRKVLDEADNGGRESGVGDRQSGVDRHSSSSSSSSCSSSSSSSIPGFRVRGSGLGVQAEVGSRESAIGRARLLPSRGHCWASQQWPPNTTIGRQTPPARQLSLTRIGTVQRKWTIRPLPVRKRRNP